MPVPPGSMRQTFMLGTAAPEVQTTPGRCTPIGELHVASKIPYVCGYVNNVCRTQAEVYVNHVNPKVHVQRTGHG
jgi:hypothetical protein